jgi:tRNA-dihydrouridine synthase B
MAGWTDSPYRQVVKKLCPEIICFSELISVDAIVHDNKKTLNMLKSGKSEFPLIVQLFGKNPDFFVEAGKKLEKMGAAGIDINMGCPAKKVTKASYGSALLKNTPLAFEIVKKLSKSLKIPVSVKIRIGYDKYDEKSFINFVKSLEKAGAKAITIHGRTKNQEFSGKADWEPIYTAKKHLKIPVIGNGDIDSDEAARKRLKDPKSQAILDGIMIGRAAFGNPWILAQTWAKLHNKKVTPAPSFHKKIPLIIAHFKLSLKIHGETLGLMEMKKHLSTYLKGFENSSKFRKEIMESKDPKAVLDILKNL